MKHRCKCSVKFCRNWRAPSRTICHKHKTQRWRASSPIVALYHRVKGHAKARGVGFLLDIDQFAAFCIETGYHLIKGRGAEDGSIDRIRGNEPYQAGNLQIRSVGFNSRKQWWDGARADQPTSQGGG